MLEKRNVIDVRRRSGQRRKTHPRLQPAYQLWVILFIIKPAIIDNTISLLTYFVKE